MLATLKKSIVNYVSSWKDPATTRTKESRTIPFRKEHALLRFDVNNHAKSPPTTMDVLQSSELTLPLTISLEFSAPKKNEPCATQLDCSKRVPVSDITYRMVQTVIISWEQNVKKIPNWAPIAGEIFLRKIFELEPETIIMFGFPKETRHGDPALASDEKFMVKAVRLIKAIDMTVGFLGPDLSPLEGELFDLGGRHGAMNCRPRHWPMVGEALFYTFEQCMRSDGFTKEMREAWTVIYNFLGYHMIRGLTAKYPDLKEDPERPFPRLRTQGRTTPAPSTNEETCLPKNVLDCSKRVPVSAITYDMVQTVITSWDQGIKMIPNWSMVTGEIFLRNIFEVGPETITMFGFPKETRHDDPALASDEIFMGKAVRLIKAIDVAINFLGPDLSPLESELFELGGRHGTMNCRPHHWPLVGRALFGVFEKCMLLGRESGGGEGFTKDVREAWTIIYNFLGYHMIKGLLAKHPELSD